MARQRVVLRRMSDWGWLDPVSYRAAAAEEIRVRDPRRSLLAPHFTEHVRELTQARKVTTTLDSALQADIELM